MKKRLTAFFLTVILALALLPTGVLAKAQDSRNTLANSSYCTFVSPTDGEKVSLGKAITINVKMSYYAYTRKNYCQISVYDPAGNIVQQNDFEYEGFTTLKDTFLPTAEGEYTISANNYIWLTMYNSNPYAAPVYYKSFGTKAEIKITVDTSSGTLSAPEGISVKSAGYNKVSLLWNAADGADSYKIYRATSKSGSYKAIKTVTACKFTDSGLTAGKTYYYKIKSYKKSGSKYSDYSATVKAKPVPAKPIMSAKLSGNKTKLTWEKVSGASGYTVYGSSKKAGTYKAVKTLTKTSYTGKTLYYKVKAYRTVKGKKVYGGYSSVAFAR